MFAIVSFKGNQYKVAPNGVCVFDLIDQDAEKEKKIVFSDVLLISNDDKIEVGDPLIRDATVEGEIVGQKTLKKVRVIKFHSKKRYLRTIGQKQNKTIVKIIKINSAKNRNDKKNEK